MCTTCRSAVEIHKPITWLTLNYRSFQGIMLKSDNRALNGRFDVNHSMFNGVLKANLNLINTDQQLYYYGRWFFYLMVILTARRWSVIRPVLLKMPMAPGLNKPVSTFTKIHWPVLYESDGENDNQTTRIAGSLTLNSVSGLTITALGARTKFNEIRGYSETKSTFPTSGDTRNGLCFQGIYANTRKPTGNHSQLYNKSW